MAANVCLSGRLGLLLIRFDTGINDRLCLTGLDIAEPRLHVADVLRSQIEVAIATGRRLERLCLYLVRAQWAWVLGGLCAFLQDQIGK